MFKPLIYAGVTYPNFEINELGEIRNKKLVQFTKKVSIKRDIILLHYL